MTRAFLRTNRNIVTVVLVLASLVVLGKAYAVRSAYHAAIERAEREARNATGILAGHAARTFEGVSRALDAAFELYADVAVGDVAGAAAIHDALKSIQGGSPVILGIGWTDAAGNLIASSVFVDPPPLNVADQDHFRVHSGDPGAGLYISALLRSRIDGVGILPVSRRIEDKGGRFAGIVNATMRADYFREFYHAINLGPDTAVLLARHDGTVLMREPLLEEWMGKSLAGRLMFPTDQADSQPRNLQAVTPIDGKDRIFGHSAIPGFPLTIVASTSREDALAPYREVLVSSVSEGVLAVASLGIGGMLLILSARSRAASARELEETAALLQSVFVTTNQAICIFDRDLRMVAWNELYQALLPRAAQLERGTTLESVLRALVENGEYGPGDADAFVAERMERARRGRPERYERARPDGTFIDVRWTPLPNGFLAISHTDITHLKRAEVTLRESEARVALAHARLVDAVDSLEGPFFLWGADERLVLANAAAGKGPGGDALTPGVRVEEVISRRVRMGRFPGLVGREDDYVRERLAKFRSATGEPSEIQLEDGRWLSIRDRRTREGGTVNLVVDVTAMKAHEAELAAAREAADAANRAKSDFLARMSHELRTPLNAVIGFSQMLQIDRRDPLTERQQGYCRDIESGGRHLLALVNDVLDLARIESGKDRMSIERVSVAEVLSSLRTAMDVLAAAAEIDLRIADPVGVPDLRADDMRLHQVLLNLVSNGIKYNRKGGSIGVWATAMPGDRVRLVVADDGIGISADQQTEVFEPFRRLGHEHSGIDGTGIGLSICKRLAEAMDGSIGFTSTVGEGSVFWIELPADTSASAARAPGRTPSPSPSPSTYAGSFSLLYVEDNPANMRLMEHLVSILPRVALLTASTPRLGLDLARAHRPHVILLDLHLPGMNGYEILAHLKAMPETADTPVIALTAAAMPSDVRRGLAAGFFRYLTKPIDVKEFRAAIDACIPLSVEDESGDRHRSAC